MFIMCIFCQNQGFLPLISLHLMHRRGLSARIRQEMRRLELIVLADSVESKIIYLICLRLILI